MNFPLIRLPRRVVHVDDDAGYLRMLDMNISGGAKEFFTSGRACVASLNQEVSYWIPLIASLVNSGEAREKLGGTGEIEYFALNYFRDWRRFRVTSVVAVDYQMPDMNGLDVLDAIKAVPCAKVLLTGQANDSIAKQAFNAFLVDKFIEKDTPEITRALRDCHADMHRRLCETIGKHLLPLISSSQLALLGDARVTAALQKKVEALGWIEYVVVGQPFGLLGMKETGPLQWLQLETAQTAKELAEALSGDSYTDAQLLQIEAGSALPMHEVDNQLGGQATDHRLFSAEMLCAEPPIFAAVRDLDVEVCTASEYGVDDILISPDQVFEARLRDVLFARANADKFGQGEESYDSALTNLIELIRAARGAELAAAEHAVKAVVLPTRVSADLRKALQDRTE